MRISFVVLGLPGPQGSKKFVGLRKHGKRKGTAILVESSKKVKPWRELVEEAAREAMKRAAVPMWAITTKGERVLCLAGEDPYAYPLPLDVPLRLRMIFTLPKPTSAPKGRITYPMRMPDGSKLQRSTEDALTSAGLWKDDARVVEWVGAKRYPGEGEGALDEPGVRITIEVIA